MVAIGVVVGVDPSRLDHAEDVGRDQPLGPLLEDDEAGHHGDDQETGDPGEDLQGRRGPELAAGLGHGPLALAELMVGNYGEGAGGRPRGHVVAVPADSGGRAGTDARNLAGLGEGAEVVGATRHRGHHVGDGHPGVGVGGTIGGPGPVGPGVDHLEGHGVAVETDEGGVPPEGGQRQGLIREAGQVTPLEGLQLGDGAAQAVMDRQQVETALFPRFAQEPPDLLGRGGGLFVLVVAPTSRSATWPDHQLSPDCSQFTKRTCSLCRFGTNHANLYPNAAGSECCERN